MINLMALRSEYRAVSEQIDSLYRSLEILRKLTTPTYNEGVVKEVLDEDIEIMLARLISKQLDLSILIRKHISDEKYKLPMYLT